MRSLSPHPAGVSAAPGAAVGRLLLLLVTPPACTDLAVHRKPCWRREPPPFWGTPAAAPSSRADQHRRSPLLAAWMGFMAAQGNETANLAPQPADFAIVLQDFDEAK